MASFVSTGWPAGAVVSVYDRRVQVPFSGPGDAPLIGGVVATATADGLGTVTFSSVVDNGEYVATDGTRRSSFKVPPAAPTAPAGSGQLRVADLVEPWAMGHRMGGANLVPDDTLEGMDAAIAMGQQVIDGGDLALGRDGRALLNMHDSGATGLNRTTTTTGDPALHTAGSWQGVKVAGTRFAPAWPDTLRPGTFNDILARAKDHPIILTPETKTYDRTTAQAIVDAVKRYGLEKSVIFGSFDILDMPIARAAGIKTCLFRSDASVSAATIAANGNVDYFGYGATVGALDDTFLTTVKNAGIKLRAFTVDRRTDWAAQAARGAVCCDSNDPLWVMGFNPALRSDPWGLQTFWHGSFNLGTPGNYRGEWFSGRYALRDTASSAYVLQGWASLLPATFQLDVTVTIDTVGGDTSRHADIGFCLPDDRQYDANTIGQGYHVIVRASGTIQLFRLQGGTANLLGAGITTAAISAGGSAQIRIVVSGTQITLSRQDGTPVAQAPVTDSVFRGGHLAVGKNGTGLQCSFNSLTIT